jgi:hypothetical protein
VSAAIRIAMWSGPRNISTAMMRSFGNRPDTAVIDEPFYAAYLLATGIAHPMRNETLPTQSADWRAVAQGLTGDVPGAKPIFYQKHMTHHMLPGFGRAWMAQCRNVFLIRDPDDVLASYSARREEVTLADIGVLPQRDLFNEVCDALGHAPPVIDGADILAAPEPMLQLLCEALDIKFLPAMLHWPAGKRDTDGAWGPAWYQSVWASTGFHVPSQGRVALSPALQAIADQAKPIYEALSGYRLRLKARGFAPGPH